MANPNSITEFFAASEAETEAVGADLAAKLRRGDVVILIGPLGAGKTHFVRGVVAALGCAEPVSSPTYAIVHEYEASTSPVYHFDFYRIESPSELEVIGLPDYLETGICLIEWGEKFLDSLPSLHWRITLTPQPNGARLIQILAP